MFEKELGGFGRCGVPSSHKQKVGWKLCSNLLLAECTMDGISTIKKILEMGAANSLPRMGYPGEGG